MTLTPNLTSSGYDVLNFADRYSYIPVINDLGRPLFAKATYTINPLGGNNGFKVISNTSVVTGNFISIQTIASTAITALTAANGSVINSGSGISGVTFPANFTINGSYIGIQLASGSVLAYNA
jgi:hypothetical protein